MKKLIVLLVFFSILSCKKEDTKEYSLSTNKIEKDTINEIYKGKVFYSGDELNDYTFITSSSIKDIDSLTYSIYKKNNTKDYVFSIEKLIDNQDQEKFKIIELLDFKNYDIKDFKITSEVVNKSHKVLLLNKNTVVKEWDFPIKGKKRYSSVEIKTDTTNIIKNQINKSENCYDYLTELVRSSNFPFSSWGIEKKKVNLEIDDDNKEYISAKLFFETDGTGTIGWVKYYKKIGKLFDTSANLETAHELKFDAKWRKLFDNCINNNPSY